MRRWPILAALLCLLSASGLDAADPAGFETVRFQHFGVEEGLSQATVRTMVQDSTGFLWLGTQDGLNRYDGYEFRVFRRAPGDPEALPDNHVSALAAGPAGRLWVGTQNGGLARFDPDSERFAVWRPGEAGRGELAANPVHALLAHRWGGLWIASGDGHVQRLDNEEAPLLAVSAGREAEIGIIRQLREAADGSVLIAAKRGVWRASGDGRELAPVVVDGRQIDAQDVAEGFDGSLWVATDSDGVLQILPDGRPGRHLRRAEGLSDLHTRALVFDRSGRLWIGSMAGLSRWDAMLQTMQVWRGDQPGIADGLSASRVQSLLEDRDGLIWVGTWLNGVNLHDPRTEAFALARPVDGNPASLPGLAVIDLLPKGEDAVWASISDRGLLVELSMARGVVRRLGDHPKAEAALPTGQLRGVAETPDGALWVALGNHGLGRRAAGEASVAIRHDDGSGWQAPPGEIYELTVDRSGTLWVGSIGGGLSRLCAGCGRFEQFRHQPDDPASLPGNEVSAVLQVADGSWWVGTRHNGVARLRADGGGFERHGADEADLNALAHPYVTGFLEDREGRLWLGTQGGGLHRVERDADGRARRFVRFDRRHGLGADAVGGILQDESGRLWVSTTAGLSRLDPNSGEIANFGIREGALSGGYFIGSAARLGDGRMLFGGPRGLTVFDPRDVQLPPPPLQVVVSEVRVFTRQVDDPANTTAAPRLRRDAAGDLGLQLSQRSDDFALDLSAMTYASPDQLRYEYRLDPIEDWKSTDARRRFAAYTGVPPGEYRFRARARRPGGVASEELSVAIAVQREFSGMDRLRQVAMPAAALLAALLLWLVWQRQRERRRAQQRVEQSEARLKLALWGTGDEMWDLDLLTHQLHRENPLPNVRSSSTGPAVDARDLDAFAHPDDRQGFRKAMAALLRGESAVLDSTVRVESLDGRWVWLRLRGRVAQRDAQGRALRVTGTTSDITELQENAAALATMNRELEQRVDERTAALSTANSELETTLGDLQRAQRQLVEQEKMAALGGLVAGVAHEINTPLGIGVTAASHLESATREFRRQIDGGSLTRSALRGFGEVAEESADLILRNLERADKLIKSFKQVAVDQSSEARRRIDLAVYIDEILTSLRPTLRKSRHEVVAEVATGIQFETLPGAIYQVFSNLIQNSLVHGFAERDGGGRIDLLARVEENQVVIDYRDNGRGMSEEVCRRVFEPFFTTRRGAGGSGLGMHIVYNLVTQALGGAIRCQSTEGEGVHFEVRLPLRGPGRDETSPAAGSVGAKSP